MIRQITVDTSWIRVYVEGGAQERKQFLDDLFTELKRLSPQPTIIWRDPLLCTRGSGRKDIWTFYCRFVTSPNVSSEFISRWSSNEGDRPMPFPKQRPEV